MALLCRSGFSSDTSAKTTQNNRLKADVDVRIQLFSIKPDFKEILQKYKITLFFSLVLFQKI